MSKNKIREVIETEFRAKWTSTSITPDFVRYSNAPFDPPVDQKWASLDVHWLPDRNVAICVGPDTRVSGVLAIDVYDALDRGTGALLDMADEATRMFANKQLVVDTAPGKPITFEPAMVKHVGVANQQGVDASWYSMIIRVPFWKDA